MGKTKKIKKIKKYDLWDFSDEEPCTKTHMKLSAILANQRSIADGINSIIERINKTPLKEPSND